MANVAAAAPQFLVDDLERSLAFYEGRLGFARRSKSGPGASWTSRWKIRTATSSAFRNRYDRGSGAMKQLVDAYRGRQERAAI